MICLKMTPAQYTDPDHDLYHLTPLFHVCSLQRRTPSRPSRAYAALWHFWLRGHIFCPYGPTDSRFCFDSLFQTDHDPSDVWIHSVPLLYCIGKSTSVTPGARGRGSWAKIVKAINPTYGCHQQAFFFKIYLTRFHPQSYSFMDQNSRKM